MMICEEQPGQEAAIRAVVGDAFGRSDESRLVDELRADGVLALSLVAIEGGSVRGHVALSRMQAPARALGVAPLSVRQADQRRGVGSALMRAAIARAGQRHYDIIFVLGEPSFYSRFGFTPEAAAGFQSRFAGPNFMALHLVKPAVAACPVAYAEALENWAEPSAKRPE